MNFLLFLSVGLLSLKYVVPEYCVCTTVECPSQGENNIVMGGGNANISYNYVKHGEYLVVDSADGVITPGSLDNGEYFKNGSVQPNHGNDSRLQRFHEQRTRARIDEATQKINVHHGFNVRRRA